MVPRIDAHTHIFPPAQAARRFALSETDQTFREIYADSNAKMATTEDLLAALDSDGIDAAVSVGFAFTGEEEIESQNRYVLDSAKLAKRRLAPLAILNLCHPGWREVAEGALSDGARGFGELRPHNQGWDPLGPDAHRLCELAAAHGVPLLWHVSEPLGHGYPGKHGGIGPLELAALAAAHPATRMVAAHLGGGLSFFLQMPEVKQSLSNIWFDTAAAFLLYDEQSISRLVGLAGKERVLFASDYPLLSPRRQLDRIIASLPSGSADAVCGANAQKLFFGYA